MNISHRPVVRCLVSYLWMVVGVIAFADATASEQSDDKPASYTQKIPGTQVTFDMVLIPAGKYPIGSPQSQKHHKKDEGPLVEIAVDALWIGKCEITWEEYNLFTQNYQISKKLGALAVPKDREADAVSIPTPLYQEKLGPVLGWGVNGKMPAVCMTQFAAKQYTKWLSKKTGHFYRLPTEAEWEYAARAGTKSLWSFGDDESKLDEHAWHAGNSEVQYHAVGKKKPNPWGLFDMHGNLAEWCLDAYDQGQYAKWARDLDAGKGFINWPTKLDPRVVRGGHWDATAQDCRSASRWYSDKSWKQNDPQLPKSIWWQTDVHTVGFRIVRPVKSPSNDEQAKYWDADLDSLREILKNELQSRMIVDKP